jgi:hypothetical protein
MRNGHTFDSANEFLARNLLNSFHRTITLCLTIANCASHWSVENNYLRFGNQPAYNMDVSSATVALRKTNKPDHQLAMPSPYCSCVTGGAAARRKLYRQRAHIPVNGTEPSRLHVIDAYLYKPLFSLSISYSGAGSKATKLFLYFSKVSFMVDVIPGSFEISSTDLYGPFETMRPARVG